MALSSKAFMSGSIVTLAVLIVILCGCSKQQEESDYPSRLRLADQYGLAYAPLAAARLNGWFEEELPGVELVWSTVGNATAIREAMLAGRLDGGCMGIPPYLIGRDRGMDWMAISAVSEAQLGLAVRDPEITTMAQLPDDIRIALPQPGSIQHILLAMASETFFGDAGRFDNNLVTLSHPDGMSALLSGGDVAAHFTSPPYLQREIQAGATLLIDGNQAFGGDYTFIVSVLSEDIVKNYPEAVEGVRHAIGRGAKWLSDEPDIAADLLAAHYRMDQTELSDFFSSDALSFGNSIKGMARFAEFMFERSYLNQEIESETLILR